jgi:hypothetical protein
MASSFGLLLDVDWSSLFKSFYEMVRVKMVCKNLAKVPKERLFELEKKLYLVTITVEGYEQSVEGAKSTGDDDD